MNKARLRFHQERQRSTATYFRKKNNELMAQWQESSPGDRNDHAALQVQAEIKEARGIKLVAASQVLEGTRREGALQRAGRLLREADALKLRAARLAAGETPLDEWARCRCGSAFQPGERGYLSCWTCSSAEYYKSSYACVFCDRRHSMSYAACFVCKAEGREDDARHLRLVTYVRDGFLCALCGADGTETLDSAPTTDDELDLDAHIVGGGVALQVSRIMPLEHGGTADPWNLETLCGTCQATRGTKSYEKLDEREFWRMVGIYTALLFEYLAPDERSRLLALEPDTEHETKTFSNRSRPDHGSTTEQDGLLNVLACFGTQLLDVHVRAAEPVNTGTDPCKGEVILSTGARPCSNTADHRVGILCETGCR